MSYLSGDLVLTVHGAKDLRDVQLVGKMDPYCKIFIGTQSFRTKTHQDADQHPLWNFACVLHIGSLDSELLHLQVRNEELGGDPIIGRADIPLAEIIKSNSRRIFALAHPDKFSKNAGYIEVSAEWKGTSGSTVPITASTVTSNAPPVYNYSAPRVVYVPAATQVPVPAYTENYSESQAAESQRAVEEAQKAAEEAVRKAQEEQRQLEEQMSALRLQQEQHALEAQRAAAEWNEQMRLEREQMQQQRDAELRALQEEMKRQQEEFARQFKPVFQGIHHPFAGSVSEVHPYHEYAIVDTRSSRCLAAHLSGADRGVAAVAYDGMDDDVRDNMKFLVLPHREAGHFMLVPRHTNLPLAIANGSHDDGAAVVQKNDVQTIHKYHTFTLHARAHNQFVIVSDESGKRLTLRPKNEDEPATLAQNSPIDHDEYQLFTFVPTGFELPRHHINLVNARNGKVIDIAGASTENSGRVQVWDAAGVENQKINVELEHDKGAVRFHFVHSNKIIDVWASSDSDMAPTHQWEWLGQENALWEVRPSGAPQRFLLVARHSNKALQLSDDSGDNGVQLVQNSITKDDNQLWTFKSA